MIANNDIKWINFKNNYNEYYNDQYIGLLPNGTKRNCALYIISVKKEYLKLIVLSLL